MTLETESAEDVWLRGHDAQVSSIQTAGFPPQNGALFSGYALARTQRLGGVVLDRSGGLLFANSAFSALFGKTPPNVEAALEALTQRRSRMAFSTNDKRLAAIVYAPADQGLTWSLPPEVRQEAQRPDAAILGLAVAGIDGGKALDDACLALGLSALQSRMAAGLVRTGDVRGGAREAGVTYQTARKVVAEMLVKVGATRLSGLISRLVQLSFGVWPQGRNGEAVLSDVWGLSTRQAALALRLAEGQTRAQAAKATGISEASAKKQLDVVYATLGVSSAGAMARVVTESRALALLAEATHQDAHAGDEFTEPLGLFARADGSQVAYSDHGPRAGRPVLVIHSSSASRAIPMRLVAALQARGFRPLALDRPGFGLTDPVVDRDAYRADPFSGACEDVVRLCDHLKLKRLDLIGRGGAQVVLALTRLHPDIAGGVVLVNPDPPTRERAESRGLLTGVKNAFVRHPEGIEALTRLFVTHLSQGHFERMMTRSVADSPPDAAFMRDPRNLADYARGYRLFLTGRIAGYVDEQIAMTRWSSPRRPDAASWRVLMGGHDVLHDPVETQRFWSDILPETHIETLEDAGRFLIMSHADHVAEALLKSIRP